jgi:selenocysteine lyase/cysteine desulfurase
VAFDVTRVRDAYPALADGYAYLDGAAGTQVPASVITAISDAYKAGLGNSDGAFPASARSDAIMRRCRAAVADRAVSLRASSCPNMTTLTYRISAALLPGGRAMR